jgi:hypothetical protein
VAEEHRGDARTGQPIYVDPATPRRSSSSASSTRRSCSIPKETADNLKKSGAFVPGIRPGDQTARYIERIMLRLTLTGSIYVTLVCLCPSS